VRVDAWHCGSLQEQRLLLRRVVGYPVMGPLVSSHGSLNAILLSNAAVAVQVHEFGHRVGMAHATVYRLDASTDAKVRSVAAAASV
jgi:hypothetical protein